MESNPTWVPVVALSLRDQSGRLLMQKRPADKRHGGLWEFPGGKVETGENPRAALVREIAEELGIGIDAEALEPALFADEADAGRLVLILYTCSSWRGEIVAHEGQESGWFTPGEAARLPMPPMDADLLKRLRR